MKKIYIKIKKVEILKRYLKNSCEGFGLGGGGGNEMT
jgi:hypothetical protein